MASLKEYRKKRTFTKTPEPGPTKKRSESGRIFVIQKHRASHLHYDFRLEAEGVLKSWAVPKGPSLDPSVKRLAMAVEDHPVDYADFEGVIPEGEYGGGTVMVWDYGTYVLDQGESMRAALHQGEIKFSLKGKKLNGSWVLVHTDERRWLLIKHRDQHASDAELTDSKPFSAVTHRTLAEIAEDEGGNIAKAASADPEKLPRRGAVKRRAKNKKRRVWKSAAG